MFAAGRVLRPAECLKTWVMLSQARQRQTKHNRKKHLPDEDITCNILWNIHVSRWGFLRPREQIERSEISTRKLARKTPATRESYPFYEPGKRFFLFITNNNNALTTGDVMNWDLATCTADEWRWCSRRGAKAAKKRESTFIIKFFLLSFIVR